MYNCFNFFRIFDSILSECKLTLKLSLDLHNIEDLNLERENILICGGSGSGKTTVCKVLANELRKPPYFVHTHIIECIPLKGRFNSYLFQILLNPNKIVTK